MDDEKHKLAEKRQLDENNLDRFVTFYFERCLSVVPVVPGRKHTIRSMTGLGRSRRAAKVREIMRARMNQRKQELPKREREREVVRQNILRQVNFLYC